jgi:hypothetical protein
LNEIQVFKGLKSNISMFYSETFKNIFFNIEAEFWKGKCASENEKKLAAFLV